MIRIVNIHSTHVSNWLFVPDAPSEGVHCSTSLRHKIRFVFNLTEKVIDTITVDIDELKLFVFIHYGWKIGTNS